MWRVRSPSIQEPRVSGYTLTFITQFIVSLQTTVLTVFLAVHLILCIFKDDKFANEEWIRLALYSVYVSSVVAFFVGLKKNNWLLIPPIIIAEVLLLAYVIYTIVIISLNIRTEAQPTSDVRNSTEASSKSDEDKANVLKSIIYFIFCIMVMAECPLAVFLSIRVVLYLRKLSSAVRTTRQLSYVGSITKESLRKEQEMVAQRSMRANQRREEEERERAEPHISVISLPLEDLEYPSTSVQSIPHIEVSDV
ncbi:hypothetical protein PMAYCL1PPCAC_32683 [Pristionchus mayeri]|uniref:Transmembrane protein n=1 Tax=Pristionchus mayeri TaxID=1317129 RepID=A0AAN5IDN7_9BILA|nr:hypothetical protein PMAYCL1PPCAC_32681 [Pristionchus mayeri]GMR62488.1 hypothetical protein PMAYCL1PPCAC_32683 [Pristionchus mayeri]